MSVGSSATRRGDVDCWCRVFLCSRSLTAFSQLFAIDGASWFPLESLYIEDDRHDEKGEGNLSRSRRGGGLGRLVLNQICAKRLAWLLMNGQLLPFVSRSYIRAFALSDAMSLRWP